MPQGYISVYYAAEDAMRACEVTAFLSQYGFRYRVLGEAATEAERGRWLRESLMLLAVTSPVAAETEGGAEIMRQAFIKRLPMVCVSLEENELDSRFQTGDRPVVTVKWPEESVPDAATMASLVHRLAISQLCRYPECFVADECERDTYGRVIRQGVQAWQDNPVGQYVLGDAYREGRGLPVRDSEAAFWLERAAEQGYVRGLIAAGQFRLDGRGVEKDEERAWRMFLRAANSQPTEDVKKGVDPVVLGLHHVGLCYSRGLGVVKDAQTAAGYFRQAAERGYAPAQYRLGLMYRDGVGVAADWRRAVYWLHRAACPGDVSENPTVRYRNISMRQMQQERLMPLLQRRVYAKRWTVKRVGGYPEDAWLAEASDSLYTTEQAAPDVDVRTLNLGRGFSTWVWDPSLAAVQLGRLLASGVKSDAHFVAPNVKRALAFYRMAAARRHSEGCRLMADAYCAGRGVPADPRQAVRLYQRAAELGNERAMFALGVCFERGIGVEALLSESKAPNGKEKSAAEWAVEWYRRSANAGYAPAQNNLGGCYEAGVGLSHDPVQAVSWYTKAAAGQQPEACCRLARCYEAGFGVEPNLERALALYRTAAELGNTYAWYRLGVCYERGVGVPMQRGVAADWYARSARQGVPEAQYAYGLCLRAGRGVRRDEQAAFEWFREAAKQGHVAAALEVGEYLLEGRLVLQNQRQAIEWLRLAADEYERLAPIPGHDIEALPELAISAMKAAGRALYRQSCCVRYGEGIEVDNPDEAALELVKQAARLEEEHAMTALADWYADQYNEGGDKAALTCAEGWYRRAMEAGQSDAAYRLAYLLWTCAKGTGANALADEAAELFEIEAERGHVEAMCCLAECYFTGRGAPRDPVEGVDWLLRAADAPTPSVRALVLVGDCYRMGWGVPQDGQCAVYYTERAAASEPWSGRYPWMSPRCPRWYAHRVAKEDRLARTEAKFRMAVYGTAQENDDEKRFLYLCEAVLEGHAAAKDHLACMIHASSTPTAYFEGLRLEPRPLELALSEVELDVTDDMRFAAMNYIGDGYFEGRFGLPCKPETAVRCYRAAAGGRDQVWAQYSLGWCLLHGVGTAADPDEAVIFLSRAAVSHSGACYELGSCYELGEGVDAPNLRVALKYYRKALKLGDARAAAKVKDFEKFLKKRSGG